jgi:hypothetical protein
MHCQQHHRHSIFCILPPYILHEIAKRGSQPGPTHEISRLNPDAPTG